MTFWSTMDKDEVDCRRCGCCCDGAWAPLAKLPAWCARPLRGREAVGATKAEVKGRKKRSAPADRMMWKVVLEPCRRELVVLRGQCGKAGDKRRRRRLKEMGGQERAGEKSKAVSMGVTGAACILQVGATTYHPLGVFRQYT